MIHRLLAVTAGLACAGMAAAGPRAGRGKAPLALGLAPTSGYVASSALTKPMSGSPVPNFGMVAPGCIYRSGQPSREGFQWLKNQGFRSVVCLRQEHDDGAAEMAEIGLKYLYIPIPDEHAPTAEQGEQFMKFAANPDNWPLLVHCHGGEGRAATMAALVRYSFDGWGMSLALKEAKNYRSLNWVRGQLCREQRDFLSRWEKTHPRGGMRPH